MPPTLRTLSILWIDDQIEQFDVGLEPLKEELRSWSLELPDQFLKARTVEAAECMLDEREASTDKLDVILLDLMLPMDDEEFHRDRVDLDAGYLIWFEIRILQKWPTLAEVPVLIITARGRPEYQEQVFKDDITRWLSKPVDPSEVATAIAELLQRLEITVQHCGEQIPANADDQDPTPQVG